MRGSPLTLAPGLDRRRRTGILRRHRAGARRICVRFLSAGVWGALTLAAAVASSCNNRPEIVRDEERTHTSDAGASASVPDAAPPFGPVAPPDSGLVTPTGLECLANNTSADADGDGVTNDVDNCPCVKN